MMASVSFQSESEAHTRAVAATLAKRLRPGDVIALEGELGAGKTVFVRGLAEGLGIRPVVVSSPTFVIRQEYAATGQHVRELVHIDAYRLSGTEELETIGWSELLDEREARGVIIAIEWPSRISGALPDDRIDVRMVHEGTDARSITMSAAPALAERLRDFPLSDATVSKCRRCGKSIDPSMPAFPFCSERCRLADLNQWFTESYRVGRAMEVDEELDD